jgi:hypothetical protein
MAEDACLLEVGKQRQTGRGSEQGMPFQDTLPVTYFRPPDPTSQQPIPFELISERVNSLMKLGPWWSNHKLSLLEPFMTMRLIIGVGENRAGKCRKE